MQSRSKSQTLSCDESAKERQGTGDGCCNDHKKKDIQNEELALKQFYNQVALPQVQEMEGVQTRDL